MNVPMGEGRGRLFWGRSPSCMLSAVNHRRFVSSGAKSGMWAPVVLRFSLLFTLFAFPASSFSAAEDLSAQIEAMKSAYAASGSIVAIDRYRIVIEPRMPSPLCALPMNRDGKTAWNYYTFPLASITISLSDVEETQIAEDRVFTTANAAATYKPGDQGDAIMVVIAVVPGKQFHTLVYDREKFERLGPGPHASGEYGQAPDDTEAFGLTFSDPTAARAFEAALKDAVIQAKYSKRFQQIQKQSN